MRRAERPTLEQIEQARQRLQGRILNTPVVALDQRRVPARIFLKLENLQPIGSFKLRGAGNAMAAADPQSISSGVVTASAGNMAQGVAFMARELQLPCTVVVPDHAPETKLEATRRLGARIIQVPFDEWWEIIVSHHCPGVPGLFIHPVSDPLVMAGNGTIGLEILEALPDVDSVVVPYGGGGLSCGIASLFQELRPNSKVYASEVATAAPLAASLRAGKPREVHYKPSFVDGIGGKSVLEEMWPLARELLEASLVVSLRETADAVRLLIERNRVVAEGAAASSVAAALSGKAGSGTVCCVVSGGNIDSCKLAALLDGRLP